MLIRKKLQHAVPPSKESNSKEKKSSSKNNTSENTVIDRRHRATANAVTSTSNDANQRSANGTTSRSPHHRVLQETNVSATLTQAEDFNWLSYSDPTRQVRTPPPEYTEQPLGRMQVRSTTDLPAYSTGNVQLGARQHFRGSEPLGLNEIGSADQLDYERIARDMDDTIRSIDELNDGETLLDPSQIGDTPLHETSTPRIRPLLQHARSQSFPQPRSYLASNYYSKVWLYANARLPPHLPPFKVYMPTYPLLCLAAQYSLRSYTPSDPSPYSTTTIPTSLRHGTKATLLLLHPHDTTHTIVLAIRGTHSFSDWAVNLSSTPTSPAGFLPDPGNLVHSGFLHVARSMLAPCAARLRDLITSNPARRSAHLLLTGHSAGGAVAALLYAHLTSPPSSAVQSELHALRGFLGRVHCITFGAPPCTLLPLQKPAAPPPDPQRKSLFFAFVNEGDPVTRAGDTAYVRSLLRLYAAPAPAERQPWRTPAAAFSVAGRVVLLRAEAAPAQTPRRRGLLRRGKGKEREEGRGGEEVRAYTITDEQLRGVVFGDPRMHAMRVYKARVEGLAVGAVTAGLGL